MDPARPEQMAQLEAELKAWFATGKLRYREVNATIAPTWKARALATPEVHELRIRIRQDSMTLRAVKDGELRWNDATALDQVAALKARLVAENAAEAAEAVAEAPLHPVALRLAAIDKDIDQATARASAAAFPNDWRSWLLLGDALRGGDAVEARQSYRKATEFGEGEPVALLGAATGYLAMGDAASALPEAREAVRLAPYSDEALAAVAASAARSGACPEALVAARRLRGRLAPGKDVKADGLLEQVVGRCPGLGPTVSR